MYDGENGEDDYIHTKKCLSSLLPRVELKSGNPCGVLTCSVTVLCMSVCMIMNCNCLCP